MKKYELTGEVKVKFGVTFKRIRALIDFGNVKKGELGGFIEKEENLSHENNAWVYDDAWVYGNAEVSGNARVYSDAEVYGNAKVYDDAWVYGNAKVSGNARVYGNAKVYGNARVSGNAEVSGNADYVLIGRIGSRFGFTTFFRNKNNEIYVSCGCFLGTLAKFRKKVKETHGTDTKYAKVYQAAADLAEMQILNQ
nr:MAG TPA: Putative transferase, nesg, ydcK, Structural Genomics.38A [Caudoviricetes sp.]